MIISLTQPLQAYNLYIDIIRHLVEDLGDTCQFIL